VTNPPCIFCDIVRGQAPASVAYADDKCIAFMDIQPVLAGHLLVIPRDHVAALADLDPVMGAHLFQVGMKLAAAMRRSVLHCDGINFFLADGEAAGQDVFHVHLHVLPRFQGDNFGFRFPPGYLNRPSRETLDAQAAQIREAL
jgi:histidine triad (HIT) family protein